MRAWWSMIIILLLLTACSKPVPAPAGEPSAPVQQPPATVEEPPAPAAGPAWRKVLESGSAELVYAAPDGSGMLLLDGGSLVHVRTEDLHVERLAHRTVHLNVAGVTEEVKLADTPYGTKLIAPGREDMALSPDGRLLAIAREGLWVADLQTGAVHLAGSEPEPGPPVRVKHQVWDWAAYPSWSEDGTWIYFYSTRLMPGEYSYWRVPAAGGKEELVSQDNAGPYGATRADGATVRPHGSDIALFPANGGQPRIVAQAVPGPYSISPDGRWVLAFDRTGPALKLYEVESGREGQIALAPESWPEMSPLWRGDRALMRVRPASYDGAAFLSLVDLAAGSISHFTAPNPATGHVYPLGWVGERRVLARIMPLDHSVSGKDESGTWLLDLAAYARPEPSKPASLLSARVSGPGPHWVQEAGAGPVTGGETPAHTSSLAVLQFDQPPAPAWLQQEVQVEGPARLETHGWPMGMAIIRMEGAREGDRVRIRVPSMGFDLQLVIGEVPTARLDARTPGGEWEPVRADRVWPRGALDLRVRFSGPVDRPAVEQRVTDMLRAAGEMRMTWEGDDLIVSLPDAAGILRLTMAWLRDARGFDFPDESLPPVYVGPDPVLVAIDGGHDTPVAPVPPEVTEARVGEGALQVAVWTFDQGAYRLVNRSLDIAARRWNDLPDAAPADETRGLVMTARHGDRVAGIEQTRWLGREGGYMYEGALVVREAGGRETHRIPSIFSSLPFGAYHFSTAPRLVWSPDGTRIALGVWRSVPSSDVLVADLASSTVRTLAKDLNAGSLTWSPDGRLIAAGEQVLDAETGAAVAQLPVHAHLRWSPDSSRVMYTREEWGTVELTDLSTGATTQLGRGLPAGWDEAGRPLIIRWESSDHRYIPQGI